ncbi:MAG: DUF885 domain-containing protein [Woeseiaceae bacterium]
MTRNMSRTLRLLFIGNILFFVSSLAAADWIEESDKIAMRVLESQAAFHPENVGWLGIAEFDGDVIDLGPNYVERRNASDRKTIEYLEERLAQEDHPKIQQDLEILLQSVNDDIETRRITSSRMLPYYNIHGLIFGAFNSLLDPRSDPARYANAVDKLRKYNGSESGYTPLTELAIARSTERFGEGGLLGPYRGALEKNLSDAPRFAAGVRQIFEHSQLSGWEDELARLEAQLADYAAWLEKEMLPRARADNQLPPEIYANNLKNYGVRATPEELIRMSTYAYQFIRSEMKSLAVRIAEERGWEDKELVAVMRRLKLETIPKDELLAVYKERLAQIEEIIRREDIVTLPERDAAIREASEAEAAAVPASFMNPPQLINNTGQFGEFVLVQSNPALGEDAQMDDWNHDSITWALTVHEARPGHELQFATLVENGTSLARSVFAFNSANVEGWGLYAESLMQEHLPLEGQLFNLFTRIMRAARMFIDPMVNTGQLTPDEAVTFLTEQLALSYPMAKSEADRYSFRSPGQATAYYYGYMSLMGLRTELEVRLGEEFNQREFHDFVLEQGLLPPELLRDAVLDHFLE